MCCKEFTKPTSPISTGRSFGLSFLARVKEVKIPNSFLSSSGERKDLNFHDTLFGIASS